VKFLFAILLFFHAPQQNVLVCTGGSAYAYHLKSSCRGLQRCRAEIITVPLEKARAMDRKPCHLCASSALIPVKGPSAPASDGQCNATTKKGSRCSRSARSGGYCWQHGG
jgi:hypothetical protein